MARKDQLASGARTATFIGGVGKGENLRKVSDEPRVDIKVEAPKAKPRKVFIPCGSILLVKQAKSVFEDSILEVTDADKEAPAEGTVVEIGPMVEQVRRSEFIVFGKYSGTELKLNGETFLMLPEKDVLGILEDM